MANLGYIQITRQCNQKCLFCSNPPIQVERTLQETKYLIDELKKEGCDGVILTGGEPTLLSYLPQLLGYCREIQLPARLITNGTGIAEPALLDTLIENGLKHCHISLHSSTEESQDFLTRCPGSYKRIFQALQLIGERQKDVTADINTVITKTNAKDLHNLVELIIHKFPFVQHFVFNGLDTETDRLKGRLHFVPMLRDFEVSLLAAAHIIEQSQRTFRIERVPLCYLPGFEHCSTETRKLVKAEVRTIHFLDRRGVLRQSRESFIHHHYEQCEVCTLKSICAGLYNSPGYEPKELAPQFFDPSEIKSKVLEWSID